MCLRSAALVTVSTVMLWPATCAPSHARPPGQSPPRKPPAEVPRPAATPFGASCRTSVQGSHVTAYCHNPFPATDRVQLHVECERWWDIDADSAPVDIGPTAYAELTQRCWKEVDSAWISHRPVPGPAGA
ncbi:hypothetical protein [Streptomyces sp. SP18CS02]|uniref:hypothetical protein n=1 Tax=Streptomyces sp. SP18CS02 TaxID=3002531 RepID=UPI003FCC7087